MLDKMLDPHTGLMIWTVISFLVLVGLMKAFAWGPLMNAVEAREQALREEREMAEKARKDAEKIQKDLEDRLTNAQSEVKNIINEANKDGEKVRAKLREEAEAESKAMLEKTRKQLEDDKNRLVGELRDEVASLSVLAAEKLIKKSVDDGVQKDVLKDFFQDLEKTEKKN